jgi:hypothetical protein
LRATTAGMDAPEGDRLRQAIAAAGEINLEDTVFNSLFAGIGAVHAAGKAATTETAAAPKAEPPPATQEEPPAPSSSDNVGIVPPGTAELHQAAATAKARAQQMVESIAVNAVPKSVDAGIGEEVVQHASARTYVPALVDDLLAKVFPEKYQDPEAMSKTIDIINKDNVLGGYDSARQELAALEQAAGKGDTAAAKQIPDQEKFIRNIEEAHPLDQYDAEVTAAANDPSTREDISRWEKTVVPFMDQLYNEMRGADPETPQDSRGRHFEARVNLLDERQAERLRGYGDPSQPMPDMSASNFRNPNVKRDPFARVAKFTGTYSTDPELVLLNSFGRRWNEVTKQRLYNAIVEKGVGEVHEPGDAMPQEINGKEAALLQVKMPETVEGRTRMVEKGLIVPRDLVPELRNALNTDLPLKSHPIFRGLTQLQLFQLADATAHTKNLHSVVANALGRDSALQDVVKKIPFVSSIDAVNEIAHVSKEISADSPAIRAEIAEMAKNGMIRPKYPATGVQRITKMQDFIHDVDTSARVIMNRRFTELANRGWVKDTPLARREFVQQIGEYNARLMGRWERAFRDMGLSPFIVAGRSFNRYSKRLVTGNPGFTPTSKSAAIKARAAQLTTLTFAATLPAIVNAFTTGSIWGRAGTPVGAIDFGPNFDTENGKRRGLDVFQLTGIRRGLRATGLNAAIEGLRAGKTMNQIAGDAMNDVITTAAHPWMGPGLGALFQIATGRRLDLRSGWDNGIEARKVQGAAQYLENARVALRQQNPLLYGIFSGHLGTDADKTVLEQIASGAFKTPLSAVGYKEFETPAIAMAKQLTDHSSRTPSQSDRAALRADITKLQRTSPHLASERASEEFKGGNLTEQDLRILHQHTSKQTPLEGRIRGLDATAAMDVLRLATPEEKHAIADEVLGKIFNSRALNKADRKELLAEYDRLVPGRRHITLR